MTKINLKSWAFWRNVILWVLCVLLGLAYLAQSAYPKIVAVEGAAGAFERFGYSQGFRLLIGILEAVGALLLLWPRTASWGAGLLIVIMMGAVYTHLATDIGSPFHALRNSFFLALIAWGRWREAWRPGGRG